MFRIGTVQEVVINRAVLGAERVNTFNLLSKIKSAPPGVVQQHAQGSSCTNAQKEGNAFVDGISRFLKIIGVCIPKNERLTSAVEWADFVAQAEVMFIDGHVLVDSEFFIMKLQRPTCGVLLENISIQISKRQPQALLV